MAWLIFWWDFVRLLCKLNTEVWLYEGINKGGYNCNSNFLLWKYKILLHSLFPDLTNGTGHFWHTENSVTGKYHKVHPILETLNFKDKFYKCPLWRQKFNPNSVWTEAGHRLSLTNKQIVSDLVYHKGAVINTIYLLNMGIREESGRSQCADPMPLLSPMATFLSRGTLNQQAFVIKFVIADQAMYNISPLWVRKQPLGMVNSDHSIRWWEWALVTVGQSSRKNKKTTLELGKQNENMDLGTTADQVYMLKV